VIDRTGDVLSVVAAGSGIFSFLSFETYYRLSSVKLIGIVFLHTLLVILTRDYQNAL
jgi:hypothetical protein